MLDDLQRKLEIGSHSERLRAVRELGEMGSREAIALLEQAMDDIDPQIQEEARRALQSNVYASGSITAPKVEETQADEAEGQESLF